MHPKTAIVAALCSLLLFSCIGADAIPNPIGARGNIWVNGDPIDDGYIVTVTNVNESNERMTYTENGGFVQSINGYDGNVLNVSVEYEGGVYYNETVVDEDKSSQFCNISISYSGDGDDEEDDSDEEEDDPFPEENEKPVIDIRNDYSGKTRETIVFDASDCRDPDGKITKYEWSFYDYPPFSLRGSVVEHVWDHTCNIIGVLTVYDDEMATSSKTFNIHIERNTTTDDDSSDEDDDNEDDTDDENTIGDNLPPVANFTIEGNLYFNESIWLNSTSYDQDGSLVNWTWTVDGISHYGENIAVQLPKCEGCDDDYISVSLVVRDDGGAMDSCDETLHIQSRNDTVENHTVKIYTEEEVDMELQQDGETIDSDTGDYFEYSLPEGDYEVVYTYGGKQYSRDISVAGDDQYEIDLPDEEKGGLPSAGMGIISLGFVGAALILWHRKREGSP